MGDNMDEKLRRDIILDNYNNPLNKEIPTEDGYLKINSRNYSCIDNLDIYLKINNNIIEDVKYEGEACVICISSTSIMSDILKGKTISEGLNIIDNYSKMINEEEYDKTMLKSAIVFSEIYKQPSRKNCATLFTRGIEKELKSMRKS